VKKTFFDIIFLIKESARGFGKEDPIMMAGALAFFTVFATPPIFIIIIFIIGFFTGHQTAETEVFNQLQSVMGAAQAQVLQNIVTHYFVSEQNLFQRILRIGIFVFASSSYFIIIQHALNRIWRVKPVAKNNVLKILENRIISFAVIFLMGFILVLALVTHILFLSLHAKVSNLTPGFSPFLERGLGIIVSLALGTLGFAIVFKVLPDVIIEWKVVWIGAAITSFLFWVGNFLISLGLGTSNIKSMYGSAGAMAIFLLWVFYSNIILFYGAEITQQFASAFATSIEPKPHAVKVETREVPEEQEAGDEVIR
jgi:membrane protein